MTDIVMPQLGESVTEGTITRWFKAVGESVTEDEPQVQSRQRPGLAGTGAGFYDLSPG